MVVVLSIARGVIPRVTAPNYQVMYCTYYESMHL